MRVGSHAPDPPLAQRWDRIGLGVRCAYNPRRPEVLQHCLQAGRRLSRLHPAQQRFIQRRMLDLLLHTVADDALPSLQTLPRPCAAFQETCMPCVNTDPFDADDLPCLDALIAGTVA